MGSVIGRVNASVRGEIDRSMAHVHTQKRENKEKRACIIVLSRGQITTIVLLACRSPNSLATNRGMKAKSTNNRRPQPAEPSVILSCTRIREHFFLCVFTRLVGEGSVATKLREQLVHPMPELPRPQHAHHVPAKNDTSRTA